MEDGRIELNTAHDVENFVLPHGEDDCGALVGRRVAGGGVLKLYRGTPLNTNQILSLEEHLIIPIAESNNSHIF